jgi:hypothetical protein
VQTLMEECALALGRERPVWEEHEAWKQSQAEESESKPTWVSRVLGFKRNRSEEVVVKDERVLIICDVAECGASARLLQQQFTERMQCDVAIGQDDVRTWLDQVEHASKGVVLLQTKSVLRQPVRLLQLFEATRRHHPIVCVNVVGGGYDFAQVKPLLNNLVDELTPTDWEILRNELGALGKGVAQLEATLIQAVPNAISVFFNPGAREAMINAAILDMIHKLGLKAQLLQADAIQDEERDYQAGERIVHSKHGPGVVKGYLDDGRLELAFDDGQVEISSDLP